MIMIKGMSHFEELCKKKLVEWYSFFGSEEITTDNVFIVWSCKTLQNYKALVATNAIVNDEYGGIYAEYTYNGDKHELYEDVYRKLTNYCYTEED